MFGHDIDPDPTEAVAAARPPPSRPNLAYLRTHSSPSHFNTSAFYTTQAPPYLDLDNCRATQPCDFAPASSPEIHRHTPSPVASAASTISSLSPVTSSASATSSWDSSTRSLLTSRNKRRDDEEAHWEEVGDILVEVDEKRPWRKVDVWSPWVACALQLIISTIMIVYYTFPPGTNIRKWILFTNATLSIVAMIFGVMTLEFKHVWETKKVRPIDAFLFFAVVCNALSLSFMLVGMFRGKVG
ncbi:hypothetical protein IAR50_003462 [Cryptococcus sp. DSM 104548]